MAKLRRALLIAFLPVAWAATDDAAAAVKVVNLRAPGAFEVVNDGPDVELARAAIIEIYRGDSWRPIEVPYLLITACGQMDDKTPVALRRGEKFRPLPWRGRSCTVQCPGECSPDRYAGPGTFRLVVVSRDGRHFAGPRFQLGKTPPARP